MTKRDVGDKPANSMDFTSMEMELDSIDLIIPKIAVRILLKLKI